MRSPASGEAPAPDDGGGRCGFTDGDGPSAWSLSAESQLVSREEPLPGRPADGLLVEAVAHPAQFVSGQVEGEVEDDVVVEGLGAGAVEHDVVGHRSAKRTGVVDVARDEGEGEGEGEGGGP